MYNEEKQAERFEEMHAIAIGSTYLVFGFILYAAPEWFSPDSRKGSVSFGKYLFFAGGAIILSSFGTTAGVLHEYVSMFLMLVISGLTAALALQNAKVFRENF